MTQKEFSQRTNVEVSVEEFEAINTVYMESEFDKDEFCKTWVAMNKTRVEREIADRAKKEQEAEDRFALANIYWKLRNVKWEKMHESFGFEVVTRQERKFIESKGIEVINTWAYDMMENIGKYIGTL